MKIPPSLLRFSVTILAACIPAASVQAAPATQTPLSLIDPANSKLNFTIAQVNDGVARFGVVNTTTDAVQVTVQVDGLVSLPGAPFPPQPLAALTLRPATASIPPGSAKTFTVDKIDAPIPGVYTAAIHLLASGADALAPQTLVLTVPGPDLLATKDTVTLFRLIPGACLWWPADFTIPVRASNALNGIAGRAVGAINRDPLGGFTIVRWTQDGKRIAVDDPPHAGSYSGTLALAKDPAGVPYTLTVIAKDIVVWPILVIASGIFLAYFVKRYVGVIRVVWDLRLQEAEIGDLFTQNQVRFGNSAEGHAFGAYSIAADVAGQRKKVTAALDAVESTPATAINANNQNYQNALILLKALQTAIAAWPDFGDALAKLAQTLDLVRNSVDGAQMDPPADDPPPPAFAPAAAKLFIGRPIAIDQLAGLSQEVVSAGAMAETWVPLRARAAALTAKLRALRTSAQAGAQATQLQNAENLVIQSWVALNNAQTPADLQVLLGPTGFLLQAETQLDQIQVALPPAPPAVTAVALSASRSLTEARVEASPHNWFLARADRHLPAADDRRPDLFRRRIAAADIASTVFAFLVALITGLNSNYFGKAFGTLADYASLFLWAAATKTTLDIVLAVADNFGIGITPPPTSAPPAAPAA